MRDEFARFGERHLIEFLEAFHQVAVAEFLVRDYDRGVAIEAGAGLLRRLLALGVSLVVEHDRRARVPRENLSRKRNRPTSFSGADLLRGATARRPSADRPGWACAASASLPP